MDQMVKMVMKVRIMSSRTSRPLTPCSRQKTILDIKLVFMLQETFIHGKQWSGDRRASDLR